MRKSGIPKRNEKFLEVAVGHIDAAVSMLIALGLSREEFMATCGNAFDFVNGWRDRIADGNDQTEEELAAEIEEFLNDPNRNKHPKKTPP
jgi:hypothetical protein